MKNALENNLVAALEDRISIVNAKFDSDPGVHIAFDIAVDGNVVHGTLEWLDADLDLTQEDGNLVVNGEYRHDVAAALGEADLAIYQEATLDARSGVLGDIAEIVRDKLVVALADLKDRIAEAA